MPSCLSELTFGSFLIYSPRGTSPESAKSRDITYAIKADTGGVIAFTADRLKQEIGGAAAALLAVLGPDTTLVPCPRSAPLVPGGLWPARRICEELVRAGLGGSVGEFVRRAKSVPKSASAGPGKRPSVDDHILSMCVAGMGSRAPARITLVDDVVTKGATLLAAASHLAAAAPKSQIRAFAVVRTMGLVSDVAAVMEPVVGTIRRSGTSADRQP